MALKGYIRKTKPALFLQLPSEKLAKQWRDKAAKNRKAKSRCAKLLRKENPKYPFSKPRKRIATRSKERAAEERLYAKEAREFVAAAVARGERCPVVACIPELRHGMKYGHPISDRLNEVHHVKGRAGKLLRDKRYWLPVSKQGHRFIHSHILTARAHGWIAPVGEWNTL